MMRTLATGLRADRASQAGFTLVEMLLVLLLLGFATRAVVLALPSDTRSLRQGAEVLSAHLRFAQDMAILSNRYVQLNFDAKGYRFHGRDGESLAEGAPLPDDVQLWPQGSVVAVNGVQAGRVRFSPMGVSEPLVISLEKQAIAYTVSMSESGAIDLQKTLPAQ